MNIENLINKNVLVAGFSLRSGAGAVRLLSQLGARVFIWDERVESELQEVFNAIGTIKLERQFLGVDAKDPEKVLQDVDLIILSPGVPLSLPLFKEAARKKIKIISEVELAWISHPTKWICVTGTDGKTTTTTLTGHMFKKARMNALVAGNIGRSLCDALVGLKRLPEFIIAELSSFQLETIDTLRPVVSVILNITPDHLDRYPSVEEYGKTKLRIYMNQAGEDKVIVNAGDELTKKLMEGRKPACRILSFSRTEAVKNGAFIEKGMMRFRQDGETRNIFSVSRLKVKGEHNKENALAASAVSLSAGVPMRAVRLALSDFRGVEHRCEQVRTFKGRLFINDSKATTLNAVQMALLSMDRPIILLMGGRSKGDDFNRLEQMIKDKVRFLVLFGEAGGEISAKIHFDEKVICPDLSSAVQSAWKESRKGEVVLLSPGCASYDEFKNFEERGDRFKDIVKGLK